MDDSAVEVDQLREALKRRPTIDMAKGIVMSLRRCTEDAAFDELVACSRNSNVRLHDLAECIVDLVAHPAAVDLQDAGTLTPTQQLVARRWVGDLSGGDPAHPLRRAPAHDARVRAVRTLPPLPRV